MCRGEFIRLKINPANTTQFKNCKFSQNFTRNHQKVKVYLHLLQGLRAFIFRILIMSFLFHLTILKNYDYENTNVFTCFGNTCYYRL